MKSAWLKPWIHSQIKPLLELCREWGAAPQESPDEQLKRMLGLGIVGIGLITETTIGWLCLAFNEPLAGTFMLSAAVLLGGSALYSLVATITPMP